MWLEVKTIFVAGGETITRDEFEVFMQALKESLPKSPFITARQFWRSYRYCFLVKQRDVWVGARQELMCEVCELIAHAVLNGNTQYEAFKVELQHILLNHEL